MTASAPALVLAKRGQAHSITVVGSGPVRMLAIMTPNEADDEESAIGET